MCRVKGITPAALIRIWDTDGLQPHRDYLRVCNADPIPFVGTASVDSTRPDVACWMRPRAQLRRPLVLVFVSLTSHLDGTYR